MQNEYLQGPVEVPGAGAAIAAAAQLLESARQACSPVFHIAHAGRPGGLFDRAAPRGKIVAELTPAPNEAVVEKTLPNAFARTILNELLSATGRKNLILSGFMTHMCVSSTARVAVDLGYRVTVAASACGTRAPPDGRGGVVAATTVHDVALVELCDRFAIIAPTNEALL